jgi:hypothetical protein
MSADEGKWLKIAGERSIGLRCVIVTQRYELQGSKQALLD